MNEKTVQALLLYTVGAVVYFIYHYREFVSALKDEVKSLPDEAAAIIMVIGYPLYGVLCFIWPILLCKAIYDDVRKLFQH